MTAKKPVHGHTQGSLMWGTYFRAIIKSNTAIQICLPIEFVEAVGSPFVLTRSIGGALLGMSEARWRQMSEEHDNADFLGFYGASAMRLNACRTGQQKHRVSLPRFLYEHAGLSAGVEAAVVGLGQAFIVTREERWNRDVREFEARILTLCSALGRIGGGQSWEPVPVRLPETIRRAA